MAFQRDYVLRLIEMMGEFFRRLKKITRGAERHLALNIACREQCGMSLDAALALSDETLEQLLPPRGLLILSELLYLRARTMDLHPMDRDGVLLRTLRLLSSLYAEEALCAERSPRLKELMQACAADLTEEDYLRCARFFLAGDYLEDCEDAIFNGLELARDPADAIAQGKEMLESMLLLPDSTLIPAGMPREDVFSALNDLEAWEIR